MLQSAAQAKDAGSQRFCMGAAWRNPKDRDMPAIVEMVQGVRAMGHGNLHDARHADAATRPQQLADAGLDYYNHNIDTSPENYGNVITTRTFEDRLDTLDERPRGGDQRLLRRHRRHGRDARRPRRLRPRARHAAAPSRKRAGQRAGAGQGHACSATCSPTRRWRRSTISSSSAPSRSRGSPCRVSMVRLSRRPREHVARRRRRCASWPAPTRSSPATSC